MEKKKSIKKNRWIGNVFLVIIFLLMPGIRGYQNLQLHEYILFVFLPIAYFIYDIVRGKKNDLISSK